MKWPWKKREEEEREKRLSAELKRSQVEEDWVQIRRHKLRIDREVELNDWTATAITLFSGDVNK